MTHAMTLRSHAGWRIARRATWGAAALVLLLPLAAMRVPGSGVDWTASDFMAMAALLLVPCLALEAAVRTARSHAYVLACLIAAGAVFLLAWANLAVGIVGSEADPMNLVFFGVPAVAIIGAAWSRLRAARLARAMQLTAIAQVAACVAALVLDGAYTFVATGVFVALWLASALLFRRAAREAERT